MIASRLAWPPSNPTAPNRHFEVPVPKIDDYSGRGSELQPSTDFHRPGQIPRDVHARFGPKVMVS